MMNAAVVVPLNHLPGDTNLTAVTAFDDIKCHEGTPWNSVYCSTAEESFRAGESVELEPPIHFAGNHHAPVGAILRVDQQANPQRVLLSLFLKVTADMGIRRHEPPESRPYIQYPSQHVIWTRYQGWYPVTRVRREAFLISPWEVNGAVNDAQVAYGMKNAHCIIAKWEHDILLPGRAFQPIGNQENNIPGCLHLIGFDCVTYRHWVFRSTVAVKIAEVLSKASLATRTQQNINIPGVHRSSWDNFKKNTIPLGETTERKGVVTIRTVRANLVVEMLRDHAVKHFARFDTAPRLEFLKSYFGSGIQGAGRIRRFAGPKLERTGPAPAYLARRMNNGESVGAIIGLPEEPTIRYHSAEPGLDFLFNPARRQLTIRVRYRIADIADAAIREQVLGLPPKNPADPGAAPAIPNMTQFEHNGTLFLIMNQSPAGEVVCKVMETGNGLNQGDIVNLPFAVVQQALNE